MISWLNFFFFWCKMLLIMVKILSSLICVYTGIMFLKTFGRSSMMSHMTEISTKIVKIAKSQRNRTKSMYMKANLSNSMKVRCWLKKIISSFSILYAYSINAPDMALVEQYISIVKVLLFNTDFAQLKQQL